MKSGCSLLTLQLIAMVFLGVIPASAQESRKLFSTPFTVSSGTETIPDSAGGQHNGQVTLLTPSRMSINGSSAVTHWGLGYQPEFEFRFGNGLANSWNHSADFHFDHKYTRRTKLDFGHSFVKSSDPARLLTDNIFVMPRDNFRENATALTVTHDHSSRTALNFRFDNTFTKISSGDRTGTTFLLNQYGVAGTAGLSRRLGERHKMTLSYSLIKFSPYRFGSAVDAAQFAASIPIVTAGIARFAEDLAISSARSEAEPTGMVDGGGNKSTTPAPEPSTTASVSTGGALSPNVQIGGQDISVSVPTGALSTVVNTTVAVTAPSTPIVTVSPAPAPAVTVTVPSTPIVSVSPTPVLTVSVPTAPAVPVLTVPVPIAPAVPVPTVPVPIAPAIPVPTLPVPTAPAVPIPPPVVVQPPVVPLVPTIPAPAINPTLPLVGVVTPLPTGSTSPSGTCSPSNTTCSTSTSTVSVPLVPVVGSTITKLAVEPTSASPTAVPAATTDSAAQAPATTASAPPATATSAPSMEMLGSAFHVMSATYTYAKGRGLLFELSGGLMRDHNMTYLLGMQVEQRFDRLWMAGGYQRFLSFFGTMPFQGGQPVGSIPLPNGVRAQSLFSALTGRVGGKISRRTELETSVSFSKSTANFVSHDVKSAIGRFRINYWLTNRLGLFANADTFFESENEVASTQFNRHRYFGGLQYRISPTVPSAAVASK